MMALPSELDKNNFFVIFFDKVNFKREQPFKFGKTISHTTYHHIKLVLLLLGEGGGRGGGGPTNNRGLTRARIKMTVYTFLSKTDPPTKKKKANNLILVGSN